MPDTVSRVIAPYRKVVISGNVVEVYEMQNSPFDNRGKIRRSEVDWIQEFEEETARKQAEIDDRIWSNFYQLDEETREWLVNQGHVKPGKLQHNIMRTRNTVRRLILSNFDTTAKFWTFTFDDSKVPPEISRDVQASNSLWKTFIQRMRRRYGDFKYLAVLEFQKRGAVHYHCLADLPYIKQKTVQEIWGNGFVSVNRIKHVDNLGAYVVKYMTKEMTDERMFGNKTYQCSKGLDRPVEYRGEEATRLIESLELDKKKEVYADSYESEYLGKIVYKEYNLLRV